MVCKLQKIGNSKGLVLNVTMLRHLGVVDSVDVSMENGRIVLTAVSPEAKRHSQSFEDAMNATFAQYPETMDALAKNP